MRANPQNSAPPIVHRRDLYDRLEQAGHARLTVVVAPPGYGKSSLISGWVRSRGESYVWHNVTASSADSDGFWERLPSAAGAKTPKLAATFTATLDELRLPSPEDIGRAFSASLEAAAQSGPIVIDNYQHIEDDVVHRSIAAMLDSLPPACRLVVISRSMPVLLNASRLLHGHVLVIDTNDLRFDVEMAQKLLRSQMRLDLSRDQVSRLVEKTEGWAAGLKLAAIDLHSRQNVEEHLERFAGDSSSIAAYLFSDIFDRLDAAAQSLLLKTSMLDRVSVSLAAELIGGNSTPATVRQTISALIAEGLFVEPQDTAGEWYRYHPLFRDFLYELLCKRHPEDARRLNLRAAEWLKRNRFDFGALTQFLRAEAFPEAAALLTEIGPDMLWRKVCLREFYDSIHLLPSEVRRQSLRLVVLQVWAELLTGKTHGVHAFLEDAKVRARDIDNAEIEEEIMLVDCDSAVRFGESERLSELRVRLRASRNSPANSRLGILAHAMSGEVFAHIGQMSRAQECCIEALAQSYLEGERLVALWSTLRLSEFALAYGKVSEARHRAQELGRLLEGVELDESLTGLLLFACAETYRHSGAIAKSIDYYEQAVRLLQPLTNWLLRDVYQGLAMSMSAFDRPDDAQNAIDSAVAIETEYRMYPDWYAGAAVDTAAYIQLRSNDLAAAQRWLAGPGATDWQMPSAQARRTLIRASIAAMSGEPDRAISIVTGWREQADPAAFDLNLHRSFVLETVARLSSGDPGAAADPMNRAVSVSMATGRFGPLVEARSVLLTAIDGHADADPAFATAIDLLESAQAGTRDGPGDTGIDTGQAGVPLTLRERQVLELVAEGMSNKKVAATLYLSPHTVKVHTANIYRKLDVGNRAEAVARGASLGYISLAR